MGGTNHASVFYGEDGTACGAHGPSRAPPTLQLARASRTYVTTRGHVLVQEVEARVRFRGSHYVYWNVQYITSFQGDPPTDSESWSLSESELTEGFV